MKFFKKLEKSIKKLGGKIKSKREKLNKIRRNLGKALNQVLPIAYPFIITNSPVANAIPVLYKILE